MNHRLWTMLLAGLTFATMLAVPLAPAALADEVCVIDPETGECSDSHIDDGTGDELEDEPLPDLLVTVPAADPAATRVRKAFLEAKKAFHEARQEIQAIKKGNASPVECVPTFFGEDDCDKDDEA